jgi:hypothetical protein
VITEEEFNGWLLHPVTKALNEYLRAQIEREKDVWASKLFEDSDVYKAAKQNAAALGRVDAYAEILHLNFSEMEKPDGGSN